MPNGFSVTQTSRKINVKGEQNRERDFVRRLLAGRAFDERDHAVEKTFPVLESTEYVRRSTRGFRQ